MNWGLWVHGGAPGGWVRPRVPVGARLLLALLLLPVAPGMATVMDTVNPHWSSLRTACLECHLTVPQGSADAALREDGRIDALCNRCHAEISKDKYIHASGLNAPDAMVDRMPPEFSNALAGKDGRLITCKTCHEISYQCLQEEFWRRQDNPRFHRLAPYQSRTEMCYFCHDKSKYQRLNPHQMLDAQGGQREEMCGYCHTHLLDAAGLQQSRTYTAEQKRQFDRDCLRCHTDEAYAVGCVPAYGDDRQPLYYGATPATGTAGSGVPADFRERGIYCGTCHNVHPGAIARPAQPGQGVEQHRQLRIRKGEEPFCSGCHDAKDLRGFLRP